MPGQGCSSAPWAPCRMQHSYRSCTVHHGVWFWLAGFHSHAAATGSLLGGRSSAAGTMSLFLSHSGHRFYDFSHTNKDFLRTRRRRAHRYQRVDCHYYVFSLFWLFGGTRVQIIHLSWKVHTVLHLMLLHTCGAQSTHLLCSTQSRCSC